MNSPSVAEYLSAHTSRSRRTSHHSTTTPQSPAASDATTINTIDYYAQVSLFGRYGGYLALFGGFLVQLTLGSWFSFGNLIPYMASYMTYNQYIMHNEQLTDIELETIYNSYVSSSNYVLFILVFFMSLLTIFGGNIEIFIGPTKTLVLASLCITLGFGLTLFGLLYNSMLIIGFTFGVMFGSGVGIGYPVHPIVCMRWFPEKRGLINGIISAVFGSGPFVFDAIQSKLVNPLNIAINSHYGYTKDYDIIVRIPFMFAYVAAVMLTMQLISLLCVKSPPWFITGDGGEQQTKSKSQTLYEADSLSVRQSMSLLPFWELWINNLLYTVVLMWMTAQWKIFAVSYMNINDDQMLAIIGSIGSLSNGIGRFLWGIFYDWSNSFRLSMGLQSAICAIFVMTLPFINGETVFTVWIVIIWFCAGCEYAFLPTCIAETFGAKHTGAIIGIFVMAEPPAMGIVAVLSSLSLFQSNYGLSMLAIMIGGCCLCSTMLSILYKPNRINRKECLKQSFMKMKRYDAINTV